MFAGLPKKCNDEVEQAEFQITERLGFHGFVGIDSNKKALDFTTIWRYENFLSQLGYIDLIFECFDQLQNEQCYTANQGAITNTFNSVE
jgi:hypothetical protein